jgi:hypothetical protein
MTTRTAALRLQLLDQVSGPAQKTRSALAALEKNIGGLGRRGFPGAQNLGRQLDHLRQKAAAAGQFTELRRGTAAAFGEFRVARSRVEELRRALATVTGPTAKMRADLRTAESSLKSASRAFREQRAATASASDALRTFGMNSRNAADAQKQIRGQMASTIQRMREMTREARKVKDAQRDAFRPTGYRPGLGGIAGIGVGGAVAARQIGAPVGKAMGYDETLTYVASTLAGGGSLEEKQAAKVRVSDAIDVALQAGGGKRDDAAAALNRMVASGAFEGDEALTALAPVVKTAHAGGASADDIAAMAVAMKNNGVAPGDLQKGFDAALKAGQLGGVELRDMAKWLPQQLALARGSGMTGLPALEWLSSANQVSLATAGSPDEAANNLINLMQKLTSRELATTMEKTAGVDWSNYMVERQKAGVSPPEAFAEILDKQLAANQDYQRIQAGVQDAKTPEDKRALLEQAAMIAESSEVGQLIADRQALMAALALLAGKDKQKAIQTELATSGGTVDRESEFVRSQTWSKIQDGKNTLDRANEQAYDALSGPLGSLVDSVDSAARSFPGLTTAAYGAGAALAAIAAGGAVSSLVGGYAGGRGLRGIFGRAAGGVTGRGAAGAVGLAGANPRLLTRLLANPAGVLASTLLLSGDNPNNGYSSLSAEERAKARKKAQDDAAAYNEANPENTFVPWFNRFFWGKAAETGYNFRDSMGIEISKYGPPQVPALAPAPAVAPQPGAQNEQKAGDTNINAPVSAPVNLVFNGVTLEQTIAAAKQAAQAVVAEFERSMAAHLNRSSQIQYGGVSANGDR